MREATLKYKGDNGIMKKKFTSLNKEVEEQREEITVRGSVRLVWAS